MNDFNENGTSFFMENKTNIGSKHANARNYNLPESIISLASDTIVTVPNRTAARLLCWPLVFLFVGIACLPFILFFAPDTSSKVGGSLSLLLLLLLLFCLAVVGLLLIFRFGGDNSPPLTYVTPTELRVEDPKFGVKQLVQWHKVIPRKQGGYDVFFESENRSMMHHWCFFESSGQRRFFEHLGANDMRAIGFKNKWEVNRAILANFAVNTQHKLEFDAALFIQLEVNPITWERDRRARYAEVVGMSIALLLLGIGALILISKVDDLPGIYFGGYLLVGTLCLVVPLSFILSTLTAKVFPEFNPGGIVFNRPNRPMTQVEKRKIKTVKKIIEQIGSDIG